VRDLLFLGALAIQFGARLLQALEFLSAERRACACCRSASALFAATVAAC
jgi:hypothetical protein